MTELANPNNWYSEMPGGGYLFTDPHDGLAINPHSLPDWLLCEPQLAEGIKELTARAANVGVDIIYHRHTEPQDLGDVERGWFEGRVARADFYGMEDFATNQERRRTVHTMLGRMLANGGLVSADTNDKLVQLGEQNGGADPVTLRYLRAAALSNVKHASVDIARDGTATERAILAAYDAVDQESKLRHARGQDLEECSVAELALHNAREWIKVAKLGSELGMRFPRRRQKIDAVMTYGALHKDLDRKIGIVGPHVTSVVMRPDVSAGYATLATMYARGFVTQSELATVRTMD
ncbi:MAG TPA: hypothetical protein VLA92_00545 [Candidatus Saccharimonadales bacterium]|nr:hypothetical protein [Candidatus Saccharimonadales bacterium]